MKTLIVCLVLASYAHAEEKKELSLFGSKPIQIGIDKDGIKKKSGGFICELNAKASGAHYSEWGETEKDARTIVHQKCSKASGLLLCDKDKVACHADK